MTTETQDPWLLTPGPLTTTFDTKRAMLHDWGSRDATFIDTNQRVRDRLLAIAEAEESHVCVPLQGSGTFAVDAAGHLELLDRLVEGDDDMGRRRKPPLLGLFHGDPLVVEIETERMGVSGAGLEHRLANDREPHSGNTFQALVGRSHDRVERHVLGAQRDRTKSTHGVDDQGPSMIGDHPGDLFDGVENARRGFAVNGQDMGDAGVGFQKDVDVGGRGRDVLRRLQSQVGAAQIIQDLGHARPVGTIDQNQGLAVTGQYGGDGGVDGRNARYRNNARILIEGMRGMGFETLLSDNLQAPIIITFKMPGHPNFDFQGFYDALKDKGFVIYPGKLTVAPSFRIGCIGALGEDEMKGALHAVKETMETMGVPSGTPAEDS